MGGSVRDCLRICRNVSGHASSQTIQYLSSLGKIRLGKKLKNQDVIDSLTPADERKLAKMACNPLTEAMSDRECERLRDQDTGREQNMQSIVRGKQLVAALKLVAAFNLFKAATSKVQSSKQLPTSATNFKRRRLGYSINNDGGTEYDIKTITSMSRQQL